MAPTTQYLHEEGDILVVDDEASVVEVVALYLQRDGFQVRVARDGREALAAIQAQLPSLVVLDVMLPELDGLEIMRRLRADPTSDRFLGGLFQRRVRAHLRGVASPVLPLRA